MIEPTLLTTLLAAVATILVIQIINISKLVVADCNAVILVLRLIRASQADLNVGRIHKGSRHHGYAGKKAGGGVNFAKSLPLSLPQSACSLTLEESVSVPAYNRMYRRDPLNTGDWYNSNGHSGMQSLQDLISSCILPFRIASAQAFLSAFLLWEPWSTYR
jgi:hypothetical protein